MTLKLERLKSAKTKTFEGFDRTPWVGGAYRMARLPFLFGSLNVNTPSESPFWKPEKETMITIEQICARDKNRIKAQRRSHLYARLMKGCSSDPNRVRRCRTCAFSKFSPSTGYSAVSAAASVSATESESPSRVIAVAPDTAPTASVVVAVSGGLSKSEQAAFVSETAPEAVRLRLHRFDMAVAWARKMRVVVVVKGQEGSLLWAMCGGVQAGSKTARVCRIPCIVQQESGANCDTPQDRHTVIPTGPLAVQPQSCSSRDLLYGCWLREIA